MKTSLKLGPMLVNLAIALILIGFVMMVQPFLMIAYTYGFAVILSGVVLFNIASHM
jgi:hypothetical protein